MYKANEIYIKNLINLINSPYNNKGENVRPKYKDGTPSYTKFITCISDIYDISKGEFPISNYRPVAWKSAIGEILWIYQMSSNKLEDIHKMNIHYWDDWDIGDGTIGQRYGATIKKYDLMNKLLKGLKEQPYGRRHIIDMYQYSDFEKTKGLNPCAFQTIWNK